MLWALLEYLCTGQEPELPAPESYFWPRLRSQHQRDALHYNEVCERNRANGIKGGRPKVKHLRAKPSGFMEDDLETQKPMGFDDDTFLPPKPVGPKEREKEKEKEKEKEREKECVLRSKTHTSFSKPDILQVQEYCDAEGLTLVDAEKFVTYYDAVGWVCGGKPMKDWKAAAILWNQRERAKAGEDSGLEDTWNPGGIGTVV